MAHRAQYSQVSRVVSGMVPAKRLLCVYLRTGYTALVNRTAPDSPVAFVGRICGDDGHQGKMSPLPEAHLRQEKRKMI